MKIVGNYVDIAKQIDDNIYVRKNDSKQHKGQNDEELNQRNKHDKQQRQNRRLPKGSIQCRLSCPTDERVYEQPSGSNRVV